MSTTSSQPHSLDQSAHVPSAIEVDLRPVVNIDAIRQRSLVNGDSWKVKLAAAAAAAAAAVVRRIQARDGGVYRVGHVADLGIREHHAVPFSSSTGYCRVVCCVETHVSVVHRAGHVFDPGTRRLLDLARIGLGQRASFHCLWHRIRLHPFAMAREHGRRLQQV